MLRPSLPIVAEDDQLEQISWCWRIHLAFISRACSVPVSPDSSVAPLSKSKTSRKKSGNWDRILQQSDKTHGSLRMLKDPDFYTLVLCKTLKYKLGLSLPSTATVSRYWTITEEHCSKLKLAESPVGIAQKILHSHKQGHQQSHNLQ